MTDDFASRGGYSEDEGGTLDAPANEPRYGAGPRIAKGGMGVVEVVIDRRLEREVARKRLREQTPDAAERLRREAAIAASLEHPGVVPVYDAGEDDGGPWYTMRLVRGRTLEEVLRERPALPDRLLLLRRVLVACEAVAYGHRRGVVHRDLKPANVMLGDEGETLVVDWGLARRGTIDERAGAVVGTPAYMSPEQAGAFGEPAADARSDVWSLGAILFEVLSGTRLVVAGGVPELAALEGTPSELRAIVARALQRSPADRYPSAEALAADLDRYLQGRLVEAYPYGPLDHLRRFVRAFRLPLAIAAIALAGITAVGVTAYRRVVVESGRLLATMATREAERGRRAEAEALAVRALAAGPSPEARGVLAAFALADVPVPAPAGARCDEERASPKGALRLCVEDGTASLFDARGMRWRRPVAATADGFVTDAYALLFRLDPDHRTELVDPDGAVSWSGRVDVLGGSGAAHGAGLIVHVPDGVLLRRSVGHAELIDPCDGRPPVASALAEDAAFACGDGRVLAWSDRGRVEVASGEPASALAWSGGRLVWGTSDGRLVSSALDATERREVRISEGSVLAVAGDGTWVAAQVESDGLWIWRPGAGLPERLPAGAQRIVRLERGRLETRDADGHTVWTLPGGSVARLDVGAGVSALDAAGGRILAGRGDGCVGLFDARGVELGSACDHPGALKAVLFDDDRLIAHRTGSNTLDVFDSMLRPRSPITVPGLYRRVVRLGQKNLLAVTFGVGRNHIDAAGAVRQLPRAEANHVDADVRGAIAVALSDDGRVVLLRASEVEEVAIVRGASAVTIGASERVYIASGHEVSSGALRSTPSPSTITALRADPAGTRLAAGHRDGLVRIFDAELRELAVFRGHRQRVSAIAWDGDVLVTGSWDGTVRRWGTDVLDADVRVLEAAIARRW